MLTTKPQATVGRCGHRCGGWSLEDGFCAKAGFLLLIESTYFVRLMLLRTALSAIGALFLERLRQALHHRRLLAQGGEGRFAIS